MKNLSGLALGRQIRHLRHLKHPLKKHLLSWSIDKKKCAEFFIGRESQTCIADPIDGTVGFEGMNTSAVFR